jgi:ParB family chromosome partitioning protein
VVEAPALGAKEAELTETTTGFIYVEPRQLQESPTNPRRHFDEAALAELAQSIRDQGMINPMIVRAMRDDGGGRRTQRAGKDSPGRQEVYEVVCGARRLRAAIAAGLEQLPVIVRDLGDDQVLELQITENLQREDVHPMDEAVGYRTLMERSRWSVEEMAARVGRSESYVYQRLKLCDLIEPAQNALWEDIIQLGHALLLARLSVGDQKAAYRWATDRARYGGETVASLRSYIERHIMLDLHAAAWKKDDAGLLPKAPPCVECSKRTGFTPALFPDLAKRDMCTNSACYEAKSAAHIARALAEKGEDGKAPLQLLTQHWRGTGDPKKALIGGDWHEVAKKPDHCEHLRRGVVVGGPDRIGHVIEVCPRSSGCKKHWARGAEDSSYRDKQRKENLVARERQKRMKLAGEEILEDILDKARVAPLGMAVLIELYGVVARRLEYAAAKKLASDRGLKPVKAGYGEDWRAALMLAAAEMEPAAIALDAVEIALRQSLRGDVSQSGYGKEKAPLLEEAQRWGVDAAGILKRVTAEAAAAAKAKAERAKAKGEKPHGKAQPKAAPAAKPAQKRGQ